MSQLFNSEGTKSKLKEVVTAICNLISNPEVRVQLDEHFHSYLTEKIDNITTALREGGRENAWQLPRIDYAKLNNVNVEITLIEP